MSFNQFCRCLWILCPDRSN